MSCYELHFCSSAAALAEAAARDWLAEVEAAHRAGKHHLVALSGGRGAKDFFAAVVRVARASGVDFAPVHFFWADERCVPPDDPESNFGIARQLLLAPLAVAETAIHRIRGELAGKVAATRAEAELRRLAPADGSLQPVLDLVLLGLGEDGHVASLFPGESEELITTPKVYRAVIGPKPPPRRVTLGFPAIQAARQVWLLTSGPGKAAALRQSLTGAAQTPLGRVIRDRPVTRIYTDIRLSP